MPAGTVSALAKDLDEHSRYIGCPNGVLDLNSGTLLRGDAAREKLVTRSVPDPYVPTARHEAVDAMLAHLTDENREWVLDALGYALRGNPARRIYVLEGPPGGGKTTLLNAVRACLGAVKTGGYSFTTMKNALVSDLHGNANAHTAHLVDFTRARIAAASELPTGRRLDTQLLKQLSGMEYLPVRDVGEKAAPEKPATATLFIAVNDRGLDVLDLTDDGLRARVRVLPYPALETEHDTDFAERVMHVREIRQAMFALLVRRAVENRVPPQDVPDVAEARERAGRRCGRRSGRVDSGPRPQRRTVQASTATG